MKQIIAEWRDKADAFLTEAHQILAKHETSKSRLISLEDTRKKLKGLSLSQDGLFQEAIHCIECGAYRASHVMAWAAFMDCLEQKLASDNLKSVKMAKANWTKWMTIEEIRENIPEHQIIEAARDVKLFAKAETKTVHGHLSKRNECAHPGNYNPGMNEAIGYVSELLDRTARLTSKKYP